MIDSLFPDNSPLRVSRVRSYRVPRYPGHNDPDPTTTPQPVPYPWKSGVAAALLALGETSCEKMEAGGPASPDGEEKIEEIVAAALKEAPKAEQNPFALALGLSGLPHVSSSYGTGAPTPLDSVVAQKLITRLFAAEGLKPQPTTFTEKDFTATAQGYDPEKRIGFFIGDGRNLAEDAMSSWMMIYFKEIASGQRKIAPAEEKQVLEGIDEMGSRLARSADLNADTKQELEAIRKVESPQAKAQAYLDLIAKINNPKLSMVEIKHAEKMAEARQRYLAVISVLDRRFQVPRGGTPDFHDRFAAVGKEAEQRKFADPEAKMTWIRQQNAAIYAEVQREQLVNLAQSVREYIAWARRNGLQ